MIWAWPESKGTGWARASYQGRALYTAFHHRPNCPGRAYCGPACAWHQRKPASVTKALHHDQTFTRRRNPGECPSVEKEVWPEMVYVAADAETSQTGSLHSSFGYWKRVVFMKIPSQAELCLLQTCHGSDKLLPWQQLQILKPLCCLQTAALRFSPCVALHIHHVLIINLPYCFAIKRVHCNTEVHPDPTPSVAHIHRMALTPEAD